MKKTATNKIRITLAVIIAFFVIFGSILLLIGGTNEMLTPNTLSSLSNESGQENDMTLKVMTLNVAHGRKIGHQLLKRTHKIKSNLKDIGAVFREEKPHIIALQEADAPSVWSGNFNHVSYLAEDADYAHWIQGDHVDGLRLTYGTAILSLLPLDNAFSATFKKVPLTFPKGYTLTRTYYPKSDSTYIEIDVISLHLDPIYPRVRRNQVREIAEKMSAFNVPLIIMGDFNCQWIEKPRKGSAVHLLSELLDLQAYQPESPDLYTLRKFKKRYDWILISSHFEFVNHTILTDTLSDHNAVVAEIQFVK